MKEFKPETTVVITPIVVVEEKQGYTKKQRVIRYPGIKTDDMIENYGDQKNKDGITYRELYNRNKDNVFRYFKIRLPLLKIAGIE
jgi:ribosomal protein L19E